MIRLILLVLIIGAIFTGAYQQLEVEGVSNVVKWRRSLLWPIYALAILIDFRIKN